MIDREASPLLGRHVHVLRKRSTSKDSGRASVIGLVLNEVVRELGKAGTFFLRMRALTADEAKLYAEEEDSD